MDFNYAVMWYCLSALQYIDGLSDEEIKDIGFEIGLKGRKGFDMDNPDKQYHIESLNKNFSGLEAVSWMYVTWQNIDENRDIGIDFEKEYKAALSLFKTQDKTDTAKASQGYILTFNELDIDEKSSHENIKDKASNFLGINKNSIVRIEKRPNKKSVIVESTSSPKTITKIDKEILDIAIQNATRGNTKYALKKLKEINSKYENNVDILENIARCYLEMEKYEESIDYYKKVLKEKDSLYSYIGIGNAYSRLGKENKAIKNYEKAIEINPEYALSYNNLGAIYSENGEFEIAKKYLNKALELEPNNPRTLYGLGLLHSKIDKMDKAKEYLTKAKDNVNKHNPLSEHINNRLNKIETEDDTVKGETEKTPIGNKDLEKIIQLSKEVSGKDFKYKIKNDMSQYAGIKIARKSDKFHVIYYKEGHKEILQHLIAHECGHLIRLYNADENERVVPVTTENTLSKAFRDIEQDLQPIKDNIPEKQLPGFIKTIYEGVIRQVTNMPVDIKIEQWIYNNYPKLRDNQLKSIEKQADDAAQVLGLKEEQFTEKIFYCTNVMNYVFLRLVGMTINQKFLSPYYNTKFVSPGKKLAKITQEEYENNFSGDIKMINRWAKFLDIDNWFEWKDFETHNNSF